MKKIFALSIIGIFATTMANADVVELHTDNCDINAMRAELNRAVSAHHAVITKVVCDKEIEKPVVVEKESCGKEYEEVVSREYFVRETVQTYKPVVHYEPAETYTTMRAVCDDMGC